MRMVGWLCKPFNQPTENQKAIRLIYAGHRCSGQYKRDALIGMVKMYNIKMRIRSFRSWFDQDAKTKETQF